MIRNLYNQIPHPVFPGFCNVEIEKSKNEHFKAAKSYCKHQQIRECQICKKTKAHLNNTTIEYFLEAHEKVIQSGKFNFEGCKIKMNHRMNFESLRDQLKDYKDAQLFDLLEIGFPIGYLGQGEILQNVNSKEIWKFKNHKGADEYPHAMLEYLEKEAINKSILGPFKSNKNQKWDPLRAMKTFIRRKVGHTT